MEALPVTPSPKKPAPFAPLINRDFAWLWYGQVVTDLGTFVFNTALVIWVATICARGQAPRQDSGNRGPQFAQGL